MWQDECHKISKDGQHFFDWIIGGLEWGLNIVKIQTSEAKYYKTKGSVTW